MDRWTFFPSELYFDKTKREMINEQMAVKGGFSTAAFPVSCASCMCSVRFLRAPWRTVAMQGPSESFGEEKVIFGASYKALNFLESL